MYKKKCKNIIKNKKPLYYLKLQSNIDNKNNLLYKNNKKY